MKNKKLFLLCLMILLGSKSFANEITIKDMKNFSVDSNGKLFYDDSKIGEIFNMDKTWYVINPPKDSNISTININGLINKNSEENILYSIFAFSGEKSDETENIESFIKGKEINIKNSELSSTSITAVYLKNRSNKVSIENNKVNIKNSNFMNDFGLVFIRGGFAQITNDPQWKKTTDVNNNSVYISDSEFSKNTTAEICGGETEAGFVNNNSVEINKSHFKYEGNEKSEIRGGYQTNTSNIEEMSANYNKISIYDSDFAQSNIDIIGGESVRNVASNLIILKDNKFQKEDINIIGGKTHGFGKDNDTPFEVINNIVTLESNNTFNGETNIYGVYIDNGFSKDKLEGRIEENQIKLLNQQNADLSKVNLYGYKFENEKNNNFKGELSNNNLIIDNFTGTVNSINNFNNIVFENLIFNPNNTIITLNQQANLSKTGIDVSFAGGQDFEKGSSMNLINNATDYEDSEVNDEVTSTAGVSQNIIGSITNEDNNIKLTIKDIQLNNQVNLLSENHAVATAFINQGTDLISNSLDTISRDGKYGLKTFASTYGNHSEYDVNSDLKINGWSIIAGVGSEEKLNKGDFAWGLFFENGNGNYRTYNQFNEEFFRGDGSIKYNGLGVMSRFEYNNGVYTEGSLRVGRLESEMVDALKDGTGNTYDTKFESLYYGAHLGLGKLINIGDNTELDIFGKFFHTYTDEDSFNVAGDKFEFDSITSDRVRVGTRLNLNKEDLFKVYCGLSYEYEFNGDSNMKVQDMLVPEQSLEGSTYITEFGINFKPSITSLWDFDVNVRGYMGEREGFSGTLQATYTF